MSAAKSTQNHDEIRRWAEKRGGRPAHVKATAGKGDELGILRIDFPAPPDDDDSKDRSSLEEISWDEWFAKFDESDLVFLYQENSNFNKLVSRETAEARADEKPSGGKKK